MESIEIKIFRKVKRSKTGRLFFIDMFKKFGTEKAVGKALERLVHKGKLHRISVGIYVLPEFSEFLGGAVFPTIDEIALAIAKRDKARIIPTGSYAQYKLGLTTQIPMNVVFYSDTSARVIKIGKRTVKFKKASSRNLAYKGEISTLVIQAFRSIGKGLLTDEEVKHVKTILQNENPKFLQHDLMLAPAWIKSLLTSNTGKK
ncbi:MAG: type IV toxin-antitoxin system AbiEi family antitoxin domain-containing protein [Prevotellaceae bacterium]|jgi:hypothetical protein|nr:type IV toxin-antitoxin system AbiEi family antitoxin domain-containing protein [Prevotellaceae bacterium]